MIGIGERIGEIMIERVGDGKIEEAGMTEEVEIVRMIEVGETIGKIKVNEITEEKVEGHPIVARRKSC